MMEISWKSGTVRLLSVIVCLAAMALLWQDRRAQAQVTSSFVPSESTAVASGSSAIAANNNYVFVLRGNMLYQFSANNLRLRSQVIIEEHEETGQGHEEQEAPPPPVEPGEPN